jgi:hypothetical protein
VNLLCERASEAKGTLILLFANIGRSRTAVSFKIVLILFLL